MLAKYLSEAGLDCILDATFNRERSRSEVREKLSKNDVRLFVIECICPEDVIIRRLRGRKNDYSDADYSIYAKMKNIFEPVRGEHLVVDTSLPTEINVQKILLYVFGTGEHHRNDT
jgi:predicted kinase